MINFTPRHRAVAKAVKLSPSMLDALYQIEWAAEPVWYHDVGAGSHTAEALLRRKLVQGKPGECGTPGHRHAGYLRLTRKGRKVLAKAVEENNRQRTA